MVKVNESRYIALFVVTRFIKKLFNYLVFLNIFFKKICQARQCRVTPHCLYLDSKNSHQRCTVKKSVLRNFAKFIGKHLCQSLFFNKVAGLRPVTLLKRDSGTGVFL